MKLSVLALLLLLGLAAVAVPVRADAEVSDDDDSYADEDDEPAVPKAFLMVRRKLSEERPQVGKPFTVTVELHNAGDGPATSVSAEEEPWHPEAFSTTGSLSATVDSLPAGATHSFSYVVTPKMAVPTYEHRATLVTYVALEGGDAVTTASPWLPFRAYTAVDLLKIKALRVGTTVTLGQLNTPGDWVRTGVITAVAVGGYTAWSAYSAVVEGRKKSKRRSALKSLGVDE